MKKKDKVVTCLGIICMVLVVFVGLTYAYWMASKAQNGKTLVATSCLEVTIEDESIAITQEGSYPLSDEDGLKTTPYTFKLVNKCNITTKVNMTLDIDKTENLSLDMFKASLKEEKKQWESTKISLLATELNPDTVQYHKVVASDLLAPLETKSYELRLWMDKDVSRTDVVGDFLSKLRISMEPYRQCGMTITDPNPGEFRGSGTPDDPYLIESIEDLVALSAGTNSGLLLDYVSYKVTTDLDFGCKNSYVNWEDTSFGDINENGILEPLKNELTTEKGFKPIGLYEFEEGSYRASIDKPFKSSFNGDNHIIRNLYINRPEDKYIGFFKKIDSPKTYSINIKNFDLLDVDITGNENVGGITGYSNYDSSGSGNIQYPNYSNIEVSGEIKGKSYVGGLTASGYVNIINFVNKSEIIGLEASTSGGHIAGVIAYSSAYFSAYSPESVCENCENRGNIVNNHSGNAAGICANGDINFINNTNYADITITSTGSGHVGGIAGDISNPTMINCTNYGNIKNLASGGWGHAGGVVSYLYGRSGIKQTRDLYNYGNIENLSTGSTGGVIGYYSGAGTDGVYNVVNNGNVKGSGYGIGGIYGQANGGYKLRNAVNNGDIIVEVTPYTTSSPYVGGIAGYNGNTIINAYNTGNIFVKSIPNKSINIGGISGNYGTLYKNIYTLGDITFEKDGEFSLNDSNNVYIGGIATGNVTNPIENIYTKSNIKGLRGTIVSDNGYNVYTSCTSTYNYYLVAKNSYFTCKANAELYLDDFNPFKVKETSTNAYYKLLEGSNAIITPSDITEFDNSVIDAYWFRDTLNLGETWKYEEGYYPQLYRINADGTVINELLPGQIKKGIE